MVSAFDFVRHELYEREDSLSREGIYRRLADRLVPVCDYPGEEETIDNHETAADIISLSQESLSLSASKEKFPYWTRPQEAPKEDAASYYETLSEYGEVCAPQMRVGSVKRGLIHTRSTSFNRMAHTEFEIIVPVLTQNDETAELYSIRGAWWDATEEHGTPAEYLREMQTDTVEQELEELLEPA